MDLFEKIITERITSPLQLGEAERAQLATDPALLQLIEQNAELCRAGQAPPEPELARMLSQVRLREGLLREPSATGWLEQFFGPGWQGKSLGTLAALAVLAAALVSVPRLLEQQRRESAPPPPQLADNTAQPDVQQLLATSRSGTWLQYSVSGESSPAEDRVLGEMLSLAVTENSAELGQTPRVAHLDADNSYGVFVPQLRSDDPRIDNMDQSIRRVERFRLQRRSNRLFLQNAGNGADTRVIQLKGSDIAFPADMSEAELLSTMQGLAPALSGYGLPQDPQGLQQLLSQAYPQALTDSGQLVATHTPDAASPNNGNAQPGLSADTEERLRRFNDFELRLGQRLENSLANYQLSQEQIEVYRHDMEQEMTMYLTLPSNWDQLQRRDLDDYVYSEMLRRFQALGIETADISREQIAVYVNDEDPDSQQLPEKPQRLTVEIR